MKLVERDRVIVRGEFDRVIGASRGLCATRLRMLCVALLSLLLTFSAPSAGAQLKTPPIGSCDAHIMMKYAYQGELDRAMAEDEYCIASNQKELDATNNARNVIGIYPIQLVNHYKLAAVQLLILQGSYTDARSKLNEIEDSVNYYHDLFSGFLSQWSSVYTETNGALLEKEGKIGEAKAAYMNCKCSGRLALLALKEKNDIEARGWAQMGAVSGDATSLAVLGTLDEAEGDDARAFMSYSDAHKILAELASPTNNNFLPLTLSEKARVDQGLNRVGNQGPRVVENSGKRQFFDAQGNLAGWERWPHALYSKDVEAKQNEYNRWVEITQMAGALIIGVRPQYPRFFIGFSVHDQQQMEKAGLTQPAGGGFAISERIEPTGVIDLDTLAIPFYRELVDLAQASQSVGVNLDELRSGSALNAAKKNAARSAEIAELSRAFDALQDHYAFLQGVTFTTSGGAAYDAWGEARQYVPIQELLKRSTASSTNAVDVLENPPDFMTAHLNTQQLTPQFIEGLVKREAAVRAHIAAARQMINP